MGRVDRSANEVPIGEVLLVVEAIEARLRRAACHLVRTVRRNRTPVVDSRRSNHRADLRASCRSSHHPEGAIPLTVRRRHLCHHHAVQASITDLLWLCLASVVCHLLKGSAARLHRALGGHHRKDFQDHRVDLVGLHQEYYRPTDKDHLSRHTGSRGGGSSVHMESK